MERDKTRATSRSVSKAFFRERAGDARPIIALKGFVELKVKLNLEFAISITYS